MEPDDEGLAELQRLRDDDQKMTPAPWWISTTDIDGNGREIDIASKGWVKIYGGIKGDPHKTELVCGDVDVSEGWENARLIEVAPELLEVCKTIPDVVMECIVAPPRDSELVQAWLTKLCKAVANAEDSS